MDLDTNKDDDADMVNGDPEQPHQQAQIERRCLPTSPVSPAAKPPSRTSSPPEHTSPAAEASSSEQGPMACGRNGKPAIKKLVKESIGKRIRKPLRKSKWNAENILIDEKSPLAKCDLRV